MLKPAMRFVALSLVVGLMPLFLACAPPMAETELFENETNEEASEKEEENLVALPPPQYDSSVSLEETLYLRKSWRNFSGEPLVLEDAAQIMWAAQGKGTDGTTGATRTAPSAGATHPLEIYLVAGKVKGLDPGVYHYDYAAHKIKIVAAGDRREELAAAALGQSFIAAAPATLVLAADYERTTARYGERGTRYVHMEVGHVTQNVSLQCVALDIGSVAAGAFNDQEVKALLEIEAEPLMIIPVGDVS